MFRCCKDGDREVGDDQHETAEVTVNADGDAQTEEDKPHEEDQESDAGWETDLEIEGRPECPYVVREVYTYERHKLYGVVLCPVRVRCS